MNARILCVAFAICGLALSDELEQSSKSAITSETQDKSQVEKKDLQKVQLGKVTATAISEFETYQSGAQIGRSMLESNPNGNGDITSILKILPNVQFDNAQLKSTTPGEISPANVSISGGLFYQNNFQLDGFTMNNDINPDGVVGGGGSNNTPELSQNGAPGRSQGLAIDTSLLDSIVVQDSNISAQYGKFNGGIIQANTRKANKEFGGSVSYQITQGNARENAISLTKYHIYGDRDAFINSTYSSNQPNFIKHIVRASAESKLNEKASVIASINAIQSYIYLRGYQLEGGNMVDDVNKTQSRESYNLFIKGNYDIDGVQLEASYAYAPEFNKYFVINAKNSDFFYQQGGHNLGFKATLESVLGTLSAQSNVSYMENSRTNSSSDYRFWLYSSEKYWTYNGSDAEEGGYGNIDNKQLSFDNKFIIDFHPLKLLATEHKMSAGLEMGYGYVYFKRHQDTRIAMYGYYIPNTTKTCTDSAWCTTVAPYDSTATGIDFVTPLTNGYYFAALNYLHAGKIALHNFTSSVFVEDDVHLDLGGAGELNARAGARLDYELYMRRAPIAPRFSLNYITPVSKEWQTQITLGANRYYGRNIFAFRLLHGQQALDKQYWKFDYLNWDPNVVVPESTPYEQSPYKVDNGGIESDYLGLKVPYDDELVAGVVQNFKDVQLNIKYIHRFGRDQVMIKCKQYNDRGNCVLNTYGNDGKSDADIISLTLSNQNPMQIVNSQHYALLAFDWTHSRRNFNSYSTSFSNSQLTNSIISYNGQFMRYIDRPAENFYRPYSVRLTTTHQFNIARVKWILTNFLRMRSSYDAMVAVSDDYKDSYNGVKVDTFRVFKVPYSLTWDLRLSLDIPAYKIHNVIVNVDINNVLDRRNIAVVDYSSFRSNPSATAVPTYEVGRQLWLQVGYKF
ncbi:TonB-dependent receptor [Helicobacter sp. 23-1046]